MKRTVVATAVATAIGVGPSDAGAATVAITGLTIADVGSNTANGAGNYSSTRDGISGGFRLNVNYINVSTYDGATFFTGDAGTGTLLGGGAANPTGSFTTGFIVSSAQFVPYTFGSGFAGTIDTASNALNITHMDFGFNDGGLNSLGQPLDHITPPDMLHPLEVLWTVPRANGTDWDVAIRWGHDIISSAEDPSLSYGAFTAQWVLEGCVTTNANGLCTASIPLPATAWLFGSGLLGLSGVARSKKKKIDTE